MLSNQTWPHWSGDGSVDGVTCLLRDLPISANEYAFGRTKIYIRTSKTVSHDYVVNAELAYLLNLFSTDITTVILVSIDVRISQKRQTWISIKPNFTLCLF